MQSSIYLPKAVYIRGCGQRNFLKIPENQLNFSPRVEKNCVVDRETSIKQLKSQSGSSEKCIMGREKQQIQKYSVY